MCVIVLLSVNRMGKGRGLRRNDESPKGKVLDGAGLCDIVGRHFQSLLRLLVGIFYVIGDVVLVYCYYHCSGSGGGGSCCCWPVTIFLMMFPSAYSCRCCFSCLHKIQSASRSVCR